MTRACPMTKAAASEHSQTTAAARAVSLAILLVGDVLHPIDHLAVEFFLDGDVRHARGGRRPVPVLLPRREPDHVAGTDLLDGTSVALHTAAAGRDDQGLSQRVRMPRRPGPGLEGDAG